jgi:hypothetical protein
LRINVAGYPSALSHSYRIELNTSTGTWTAYFDNATWTDGAFTHSNWVNLTGDHIEYYGEVLIKESDLPGTTTNHCRFSNCNYRATGGTCNTSAGLAQGGMVNDYAADWDTSWIDGSTFEIWDENPLP